MKELFAISISLLLLFQSINIQFNDLLEMDGLVEHYQFHKAEYGDNFLVFLSKHYGELKEDHQQKHQEEQQDHDKLPFQNLPSFQLLMYVSDLRPYAASCNSEIQIEKSVNFWYQNSYSFVFDEGLFQPPKQV